MWAKFKHRDFGCSLVQQKYYFAAEIDQLAALNPSYFLLAADLGQNPQRIYSFQYLELGELATPNHLNLF